MANAEAIGNKHLIDIVKYRFWWFLLSAILILPGIVAMIYSSIIYPTHAPLKVGIDYTGGTILQYSGSQEYLQSCRTHGHLLPGLSGRHSGRLS